MEVSIEYYLLVNLGMNFLTLAAIARCRGQVRWIALICAAAAGARVRGVDAIGGVQRAKASGAADCANASYGGHRPASSGHAGRAERDG